MKERVKLFHNCLQLQAQVVALQASPSKEASAQARAEAAGACAAEEVKKGQELVQAHAAELAHLQQRLQAAKEDAEDRLVVADKLATAQEWLKELGRSRKKWMLTGRCLKPRMTALLLTMPWFVMCTMPVLSTFLMPVMHCSRGKMLLLQRTDSWQSNSFAWMIGSRDCS